MNTKIIIDIIGTCINTIVLGFAIDDASNEYVI